MVIIGEAEYEDGDVRPADSAEITYEEIGVRDHETLAEAQAWVDEEGRGDDSSSTYLRVRAKPVT